MNKLGVGILITNQVYRWDNFEAILEDYFVSMSKKVAKKLREDVGESLPPNTQLKIEFSIKPYLEDTDVDLR